MTTFTSTVPGAIASLQDHFNVVASNNPGLNPSVYIGLPTANVSDCFLMIGDNQTGMPLVGYKQDWRGFPAAAARKSEAYGIRCALRVWSGDSDPIGRLNDAFTLLNGVLTEVQNDPQASESLSPSGSWQVASVDIPLFGPFAGAGWGAVMTFTVQIINVQLPSS